jgi:tetratricopeptide (TPR) repeat protein
MSPEDWREVEEAFHLAADDPSEFRQRRLERLKPGVRTAVERLLKAQSNERDLLRRVEGAAMLVIDPVIQGPWRLVRRIGEGGMGAVYLGVRADDKFEKAVAVKFVRWALDSPEAKSRFERERRILGRFEHPNIARVLDAGETADGLPYLVMEYVDGPDICTYCRSENLTLRQRLELFLKVAQAVEHVHRHSVLHLDLKPANVLIDPAGEPRLVDFGLARPVDPLTAAAASAHPTIRMFTPAYASPEQFAGRVAGPATDVYGLGAILFEILAGKAAFQVTGMSSSVAERMITRGLAAGPSVRIGAGAREVKGDLDNIVMKAMRPDPAERYESAALLAEDVVRYLIGRPVLARDYTAVERAWKFGKRHRVWVAMAVIASASLAAGITLSRQAGVRAAEQAKLAAVESRRAAAEKRRADVSAQEAQSQKAVADSRLEGQLESIAKSLDNLWEMHGLPGNIEARRSGLAGNEQALRAVLASAPDNRQAQYLLGWVWNQLGYLESRDIGGGREMEQGWEHLLRARNQFRRLVRERPGWTEPEAGVVEVSLSLGYVLRENSTRLQPSLAPYDEGLTAARNILKREPQNQAVRERLPSLLAGRLLTRLHRDSGAVTAAEIAAARRESEWAVGKTPADPKNLMSFADIVSAQADEAAGRGHMDEILARSLELLSLREKCLKLTPLDTAAMEGYILACPRVITSYRALEGSASANAEGYAAKMKEVAERMAVDPSDHRGQFDLAMALVRLGESRFARGSRDAGLDDEERGNAILRREVGDSANAAWKRQYSNYASALGDMYRELGREADAGNSYATALAQAEASLGAGGSTAAGQRLKARALIGMARCAAAESAAGVAAKAVSVEEATDGGKAAALSRAAMAQVLGQAALVYVRAGDTAKAAQLAASSSRLISGLPETALRDWSAAERDAVLRLAGGGER